MYTRDYLFNTYAKLSEKLTFLTPGYAHVRVCIRGYVSFSENFAYARNVWTPINLRNASSNSLYMILVFLHQLGHFSMLSLCYLFVSRLILSPCWCWRIHLTNQYHCHTYGRKTRSNAQILSSWIIHWRGQSFVLVWPVTKILSTRSSL